MNPMRISGLVAGLASVALLPACGSSSNRGAGGLCAGIAQVNGHRYNSAETYGIPIKLGAPFDQPIAVPACGDGEDTTTRGWAIDRIPTDVAVYAPKPNDSVEVTTVARTTAMGRVEHPLVPLPATSEVVFG